MPHAIDEAGRGCVPARCSSNMRHRRALAGVTFATHEASAVWRGDRAVLHIAATPHDPFVLKHDTRRKTPAAGK